MEASNKFAGKLKYFLKNWEKITSNQVVLSWVKGFKIPFSNRPSQTTLPSTRLCIYTGDPMQEAINDLLSLGAINRCLDVSDQYLSSYFLVDKPNGKKRFILNLKNLNNFVKTLHFKMEDHRTVSKMIQVDSYMCTIDLKDAYFLISIDPEHRKYLRFRWNEHLYEFSCLPFGLACAPYTFTKIIKPIISKLRSQGISCVNYLDDFLIFGHTFAACERNVQYTIKLLYSLGFEINAEKSVLQPSKRQKFLGFNFDSENMSIYLPDDKRLKILTAINFFLNHRSCKIREWAQFIGLLISACPAIKYGWLYTKSLEREKFLHLKINAMNFDARVSISNKVVSDLNWWKSHILTSHNNLRQDTFDIEIFTDSSLTGWGACTKGQKSNGWWSEADKSRHINFLELKAIYLALRCFARSLHSCNILIRCDNTTAVAYINRMGSIQHPELHYLTKNIWQWCETRNLFLVATYINTHENWEADFESRKAPSETEWALSPKAFLQIIKKFGKPEIDLFASSANNKCQKFVSWHPDPNSAAVDAFTLNWHNLYFYSFPPFSLILRTIRKIINDRAEGIIVVPWWPAQPWFPLFLKYKINDQITFKPSSDLLICPFSARQHPMSKSLSLVAAVLSARHLD